MISTPWFQHSLSNFPGQDFGEWGGYKLDTLWIHPRNSFEEMLVPELCVTQHTLLLLSGYQSSVLGPPSFSNYRCPQTVIITFHKSSWTFWPYNSFNTTCRELPPSHILCFPTAHWLPNTFLSAQVPAVFPHKRLQENWKHPTEILPVP